MATKFRVLLAEPLDAESERRLNAGADVAVSAEDNAQLRLYALGALVTHRDRIRFGNQNLEVVMHIVQPRAAGQPWKSSKPIAAVDLMAWLDDVVVPAARAADSGRGELVPGETQCRFCPAKVECPALRKMTQDLAHEAFTDPVSGDTKPKMPDVERLTPEQIAGLLAIGPRVVDYLKAVEKRAAELASDGVTIPGHKMVERIGLRKWNDEEAAEAALRGAGVDPFEKPKLLSPAKAEKALGKKQAKLVADLAHKPVTGTLLVPDSDKRPAVDRTGAFRSILD